MSTNQIQQKITQGLMGIYCITNTVSGGHYVGSSRSIHDRLKKHLEYLNSGRHENPRLSAEWQTNGPTAFIFKILEIVTVPGDLVSKEIEWMQKLGAVGALFNRINHKGGPRTLVSLHRTTKEKLEDLGYKSINEAILSLMEK